MHALLPVSRPLTRGDCRDVPRPCPFVSCRFNLLIDVNAHGAIRFNATDLPPVTPGTNNADFEASAEHATDVWASAERLDSCALDVIAARGCDEMTFDQIASAIGVSRQRVERIVNTVVPTLAHPIRALTEGA